MSNADLARLRERAQFVRTETVRLIEIAKSGHYTSVFSAAEIFSVLYYHTMRISELAGFTNAELSRLSHLITRLHKRGYVRREPDPNDGRYTNAVLTAAGYNHLVAAAPGHVATVLELVIDALDDTALSALQDSAERITARIDNTRHSAERRSAMSSISPQTAIDEPEGLDQH